MWHKPCATVFMAKKIEEWPVYSKVTDFWVAVNAILDKPQLQKDRELCDQLNRANGSIPSNLVEGFEQSSDRAFANFLTYSKASLAEIFKRVGEQGSDDP